MSNTYSYFDVVEAVNSLASYAEDALEALPSEEQLMMQHAQV